MRCVVCYLMMIYLSINKPLSDDRSQGKPATEAASNIPVPTVTAEDAASVAPSVSPPGIPPNQPQSEVCYTF
ncbi:hypothetical protein AB6A40_007451 [Gnathostoma spinigerum]|uniref:Uncharacterized protein n=1 Tax=Gnathostoma spinigerum TaxID=75299 RepID=A0ABD6ENG3_9BILA